MGLPAFSFDYDQSDIHASYNSARALPDDTVRLWMTEIAAAIDDRTAAEKRATGHATISRIVDLGCGTGRFSSPLRRTFGAEVIGIDPSGNMLGVARETVIDPDITFAVGTAEAIPVDPGISLLFMSMCFHYFKDRMDQVLPEFDRVVEPGGWVVIRNTTKEEIDLLPMFDFFPEARATSVERMPSESEIVDALTPTFELVRHKRVVQRYAVDGAEYVDKIGQRGLSSLKMLSDDAFQSGMTRLRAHVAATTDLDDLLFEGISLFVFRKPWPLAAGGGGPRTR